MMLLYYTLEIDNCRSLPCVKDRAILEGAIVVVSDVVSDHCLAGTVLWHLLHHHCKLVFGIEDVHHQYFKHQRGLRRDLGTC